MATTLHVPQSRWDGRLTREFSSSATGSIYFSTSKTLGITEGWFVFDPTNTNAEMMYLTNITGTPAEYTGTVTIRGLREYGSDTNISGNQKPHRVSSRVIISDNHNWLQQIVTAFNTHEDLVSSFHGVAGIGTTASRPSAVSNNGKVYFSTDDLIAFFSDGITWNAQSAGTQPDAGATVKGVTKLTVAPVAPSEPIAVGENDPRMISATDTQNGVVEIATHTEIINNTENGTISKLAINPKTLSDASISTSSGVSDAGKYLRANNNGKIDSSLLSISGTTNNTGSKGDLMEITGSDTIDTLKRNITLDSNTIINLTASVSPDTFSGFVNNNGTKVLMSNSSTIVGIYPGDDTIRGYSLSKNSVTNVWSGSSTFETTTMMNGAINMASISYGVTRHVITSYNGVNIMFSSGSGGGSLGSVVGDNTFTVANVSTDKLLCFYSRFGTGYNAVVLDYSGSLSLGTPTLIDARSGGASMQLGAIKLNNNKILLIYSNNANNQILGMIVSISGTTITTNTPVVIESGSFSSTDGVICAYSLYENIGTVDKAVIVLRRVSGAVTSYLITSSGSTFTAEAITGLLNSNYYGTISSDVLMFGSSVSTAVGYTVDIINKKFIQRTKSISNIPSGYSYSGIVSDSTQALRIMNGGGASIELAHMSPTHEAPFVATDDYTSGGSVVASNTGEVYVPSISGTAGDIQYLSFSGISNTRINNATKIGVAKNSNTIILS